MPEQPDEDLVPPLKVMRKRLNGVYRADSGFSGPTRRYVLIVALLVGLASVPTLAAITAGSSELADGGTDTMDIPFLPPASPGPVRGKSHSPGRLPADSAGDSRVGSSPWALPPGVAGTLLRTGRLLGEAGERRPKTYSPYGGKHATRKTGSDRASASASSGGPAEPPSMVAFPALPGMPALPRLPAVGGRSARHAVPSSAGSADASQAAPGGGDESDGWSPDDQCPGSTESDRSTDRSEHSRRSAVAERPHNIRPARIIERSYSPGGLNRRRMISEARAEDNQIDRPYRGSHRAGSQHHADDTAAQLRSSRVGRHHAEHTEDVTGRW